MTEQRLRVAPTRGDAPGANSALGLGRVAWYAIAMMKSAAVLFAFAVMASGCGESTTGGSAGTSGNAGSGGVGGAPPPPPPPPAVDQSCRDWCANEPEGPSCHQGPFESVQPCYEDCLRDYQNEAERQCGDEWIAIKDCQLDLDCEDLFGDCDPLDAALDECHQRAWNRDYCEANCPDFNITQCEQDTTECRQFAAANSYCESHCPTQDREECIAQQIATGTCEYREATSYCRNYCTAQDLSQCIDQWLSSGACEFNDGWTACSQFCPPIGSASRECADYWDATGMCPRCQAGLIDCNGTCVDPATNDTYCGASGDCQGGNAGITCADGVNCDGGICGSGTRIFVTGTRQDADFGGIAGADALCASQAAAASLGGEFKAWLSTIVSPVATRLAHSSDPYVLVDGTLIAANWFDLIAFPGSISAPINLDASGVLRDGEVWTGSSRYGHPYGNVDDCEGFTSGSTGDGLAGSTEEVNLYWTEKGTRSCSTELRLYCFEQ